MEILKLLSIGIEDFCVEAKTRLVFRVRDPHLHLDRAPFDILAHNFFNPRFIATNPVDLSDKK